MRKEDEWSTHDFVIAEAKRQKLPYPNKNHMDWTTYTNPDQKHNFGVTRGNEETLYPDLVVVAQPDVLTIVGEVETETTISEEEAEQWNDYSKLCNTFYLYVPEGYEDETKRLLESNNAHYTGIRTYTVDGSTVTFTNVQ